MSEECPIKSTDRRKACPVCDLRHGIAPVFQQLHRIRQTQSVDVIAKMDSKSGTENMRNAAAADVQVFCNVRY